MLKKPIYEAHIYERIRNSFHSEEIIGGIFFKNLCKNDNAIQIVCDSLGPLVGKKLVIGELSSLFYLFKNPYAINYIIDNIDFITENEILIFYGLLVNPLAHIIFNKCYDKLKEYSEYFTDNKKPIIDDYTEIEKKIILEIENIHSSKIFETLSYKEKIDIIEKMCKSNKPLVINFIEKKINYLHGQKTMCNLFENPLPEAIQLSRKVLKSSIFGEEKMLLHYPFRRSFYRNPNPNLLNFIEELYKKNSIIQKQIIHEENAIAQNPNALHLLFKWDYERMKLLNKDFNEELAKKVFNPKRIYSISNLHNISEMDYLESLSYNIHKNKHRLLLCYPQYNSHEVFLSSLIKTYVKHLGANLFIMRVGLLQKRFAMFNL